MRFPPDALQIASIRGVGLALHDGGGGGGGHDGGGHGHGGHHGQGGGFIPTGAGGGGGKGGWVRLVVALSLCAVLTYLVYQIH
jgi:hypothetical protein